MSKNKTILLDQLRFKKNQLDWQRFNFLENLLVFCTHPELSVPKESGVHFRIALGDHDPSLCVLFKIDRKDDPLVTAEVCRPDYMVLYVNKEVCICTIIEMKGTGGLKHGLNQVKELRQLIRDEISKRLPNRFRAKLCIQAILLAPYNSQIPSKQIACEAANGFHILALQYHHKAELFPYISRRFKVTEKYKHEVLKDRRAKTFIESLLNSYALPDRVEDSIFEERAQALGVAGIYLNYLLSEVGDYGGLLASATGFTIALNERNGSFRAKIRSELLQLKLQSSRDFDFISAQ